MLARNSLLARLAASAASFASFRVFSACFCSVILRTIAVKRVFPASWDWWHWFSLIEGRKLYWVGIREKRSQYKLRRK
jgi:hypothetical protein